MAKSRPAEPKKTKPIKANLPAPKGQTVATAAKKGITRAVFVRGMLDPRQNIPRVVPYFWGYQNRNSKAKKKS